ncbi:endonuclease domain-containing protein [Streptomyces sp. NPDC052043]|uniref:endonuclease domain-containing protein n=1 Tax=Streptomyces sp. NPDC052043 TaxID=3365684 RepID=UPI0037CFFF8C
MTATAMHQRPRKSRCGHRLYGLSCQDYDRLIAHANGACQICGAKPEQTGHGFLVVDHDDTVGQWAVRGLLCQDCNSALPMGAKPAWAADYLARPWWKLELARLGASAEPAPEPPIGSMVAVHGLNFRRDEDGWKHVAGFGGTPRTWEELNRRYVPHRIEVLAVPQVDDASGWPRPQRVAYVISALRAGVKPSEVTRVSGWTYATVRKLARAADIQPDERYEERAARLRKPAPDTGSSA